MFSRFGHSIFCCKCRLISNLPIGVMLKTIAIGAGRHGFVSRAGRIVRCHLWLATIMTFLRCPDAKPRSWIPLFLTRFGVILQVIMKFFFFLTFVIR